MPPEWLEAILGAFGQNRQPPPGEQGGGRPGNAPPATPDFEPAGLAFEELIDLPGARGEQNALDQNNIERISGNILAEGWDPSSEVMIRVKPDGTADVWEGNHRLRAARELGIEQVPVRIFYEGGGEAVEGAFMPEALRRFIVEGLPSERGID